MNTGEPFQGFNRVDGFSELWMIEMSKYGNDNKVGNDSKVLMFLLE